MLHFILNSIFPNFCKLCNNILTKNNVGLCSKCFKSIPSIKQNVHCSKCFSTSLSSFSLSSFEHFDEPYSGYFINPKEKIDSKEKIDKIDIQNGNQICFPCKNELIGKHYYNKNISLFSYNKPIIKELIHDIKFKHRKIYSNLFIADSVRLLSEELQEHNDKIITMLPVPLSRQSQKSRGFNQSHILAKKIAKTCNIKYSDKILLKIKDNKKQSTLKFKERIENPKGCYKAILEHDAIKGTKRLFLLIDDVFSTGSTVNECARILKISNNITIISFTIAR